MPRKIYLLLISVFSNWGRAKQVLKNSLLFFSSENPYKNHKHRHFLNKLQIDGFVSSNDPTANFVLDSFNICRDRRIGESVQVGRQSVGTPWLQFRCRNFEFWLRFRRFLRSLVRPLQASCPWGSTCYFAPSSFYLNFVNSV